MSVNVIDTIKPKNGGSFPVVEAVDVAVSGGTRLDTALAAKANTSDLASKADKTELTDIRTTMALKANQSSLDALSVIVSNKAPQSTVDALSVIVEKKADKNDYSDIYRELDTKASITELNNAIAGVESEMSQGDAALQEQIDQIEISASAEAVVAPEVAAARVGADGTSYQTLKARCDAETSNTRNDITRFTDNYYVTYESGKRNMADIFTVVEDVNWICALVECEEGQTFHIKGSGGSANQLYMFADSNGNVFSSAGSIVKYADYVEVVAPINAHYLVLNSNVSEAPTYIGSCIVNSYLRDEISTRYNQLKTQELRKYTQEGKNVSAYSTSAGNTDWFWLNNEEFPAGYIDHFVVYGTDSSIGNYATVAVYDKTLGKFLWKSEKVLAETKTITVPCGIYFEHDIYVCVSLPYLAHNSVGDNVKYAKMWEFALWEEGAVFDIEWEEADVKFKFAVECWYNDYINTNELQYSKQKNRLFVAGDSITAGYPYTSGISRPNYYDPDIKWGAQVARKLGFEVTFGAQTGAGWISQPYAGSEYAISIANNTNFANYDTVVFAFGTNDYGANIPLGELTDMYPTNSTVCGSINYVLNKIYTDNPKAVVILSSPINRSDRGTKADNYGYGTENTQGYTLLDLVNKMKELCEENGICFIDNSHSPFNKYNLAGLLMDNLHPNPTGYKILGAYLANKIENYVSPYTRNVLTAIQK